jgi:CubicO group peptidase (beta-lactamase class C family)
VAAVTRALPRVLSLLVFAALAILPPSTSKAHDVRKLESEIAEVLKSHGVPGASVAVVVGERIVWTAGIGVAENGLDRTVESDTLFQAASISKPVAAMGALRLVESGKLALDGAVGKHLGAWASPGRDAITLRQLLSHTSGLSVHGFRGYPHGAPVPSLEQVLFGQVPANSQAIVLTGRPGAQYRYSGGGYTVLQQVMIEVTGEPFPQAMAALVLGPLAMKSSTYEQPLPENLAAKAATGHDPKSHPIAGRWNTYPEMAAAGLWTTAPDLARYMLAVQKAYSGQGGGPIEPASAREMLRSQFADPALAPGAPGLGPFVNDARGTFGHAGTNNGYKCWSRGTKSLGHGLVIMTNSDNGNKVFAAIERLVDNAFARN